MRIKKRNTILICFITAITFLVFLLFQIATAFAETRERKETAELKDARAASAAPASFNDLWTTSSASIRTGVEITYDYLDLKGKKGMEVAMDGNGATITYKNPVDISQLTAEDVLLKAAVTPREEGLYDLGNFTVILTDVEDPENKVYICASRHTGYSTDRYSVFTAGTDEYNQKGVLRGYFTEGLDVSTSVSKTENNSSTFYGRKIANCSFVAPVCLRFDYANKTALVDNYANNGRASQFMIMDLDEPKLVGRGNEWKGFSTGKAYVSIKAGDVANAPGKFVITEFMGQDYTGEQLVDTTAPILTTQADNSPQILSAVKGMKYPLFSATANDLIDGTLDARVEKKAIAPSGEVRTLTEEFFIPTEIGKYTLQYSVADDSGNVATKAYELDCRLLAEKINLELDGALPSAAYVGQSVALPGLVASGGVGGLRYETAVTRVKDGTALEVADNQFTPTMVGDYEVAYKATDYLGNVKLVKEVLSVTRSLKPICTFPKLSKALLADKKVQLPTMTSLDYISDRTHAKEAVVELYASRVEGELGERIDYLYTPTLPEGVDKQDVYLTYRTYCAGYADSYEEKTYTVSVVRFKQLTDNFIIDEGIDFEYKSTYINFSTAADGASMQYMTPLSAASFAFTYEVNPKKNNFSALEVTLVDSVNSAKSVVVRMEKSYTPKLNVYVNGEKYEMTGSFLTGENGRMSFRISSNQKYITDSTGARICNLTTYSDGTKFEGFASHKVYATVKFVGVTGDSEISLMTVGNQPIFASILPNGTLQTFKDRAAPFIAMDGEIGTVGHLNEKLFLPTARAFDGLDPYVECFVRVIFNGAELIEKTNASAGGLSVTLTEYGSYSILYSAQDSSGRKVERSFTVNVVDEEAPTIMLTDDVKETMSVGETLYVPDAIVQDNLTSPTLFVFIIQNDGKLVQVENDSYVMQERGQYILRYCAYDYERNYTFVEYVITVV